MKRFIYLISLTAIICSVISVFTSCEKYFLEKPRVTDLNVDSIFSTRENALTAITRAYAICAGAGISIVHNDANFNWICHSGTLAQVSQELLIPDFFWFECYDIQRGGLAASGGKGAPNVHARSIDGFHFNWTSIRHAFLVMENIDKVSDMSPVEKAQVKAEMKTLIAYRYTSMLIRYGGVPLVKKALLTDEDVKLPRAPLQDLLDYIVKLCNEAVPDLPNSYRPSEEGRVTKGVAMAVKAEALLFAARPLFNASTPYMDLGRHNNLICFGNEDQNRWRDAIEASEAVLKWAGDNNYYIINTGNPLDDYGLATSQPGNREILFAYKRVNNDLYNPRNDRGTCSAMSFYQLKQYYKQDGTDQVWPEDEVNDDGTPKQYPYQDYYDKIQDMEGRYKASAMGAGIHAWNNPTSALWSVDEASKWLTFTSVPKAQKEGSGRRAKFWWHAEARTWFEYPIYRLAEFYLNLAEAYNEIGETDKALANLKVIRDRAGFVTEGVVTERDKNRLRKIIQREWAVEFYEEGHAIFDVKHWKHEDIANIVGGVRKSLWWYYVPGRSFAQAREHYESYSVSPVYNAFWNSTQYLCPFPAREVNKGYLVQNPGY